MNLPFDVFQLVIGVVGGLALFLYGLDKIGEALKYLLGHKLRRLLLQMTSNRFMGLFTGALMTLMLQSSAATTVLLVGFVSAELVSLSRALAVVLGTGIGTAITVQMIAFKLADYALLPVAVGFILQFLAVDERLKQVGHALMGLGLLFLGIGLLSHSVAPLENWAPFTELMGRMSSPVLGIIMAAAFTAVVQSTAATMAVVIALGAHGFIGFEGALMTVLGANIGNSFMALMAAVGKPREAVRTAVANTMFRVVGTVVVLVFIGPFMQLVHSISPHNLAREVANAHLLFNIGMALLFLPFIGPIAKLMVWLLPSKADRKKGVQAEFLDEVLLNTPMLAFAATRQELSRVGDRISIMMRDILPVVTQGSRVELHLLKHQDDAVDDLHGQIVNYLAKASQLKLTEEEQKELLGLIHIANALENIGDLIETNLVALGKKRIRLNFEVSDEDMVSLEALHKEVAENLARSVTASLMQNTDMAGEVIAAKAKIRQLVDAATRHEAKRLASIGQKGIDRYTFEHDIIDKLQRIYYHARKMAQNTITPGFNNKLTPAE